MSYADTTDYDLAYFGGDRAALERHRAAVHRATRFIHERLGYPENLKWMAHGRLEAFDLQTFDQIRNENSPELMETLADLICSGRIPVEPLIPMPETPSDG